VELLNTPVVLLVVVETVPPVMVIAPVDSFCITLLDVAETVPPLTVNVPVLLWSTALPFTPPPLFAMSAVLVIETEPAVAMVPEPMLPVIFPLSVTAPQTPLKLADAVPMSNVALPSPNCMAASPLPSVLMASMTL
jgi:hypothetical protein